MAKRPLIGLVGPCASGKSTLAELLAGRGHRVRHIAQEHSFIPDMWKRLTDPDVLIFLDASYETTLERRGQDWWSAADYREQARRLEHARRHADLILQTDQIAPEQLADRIEQAILRAEDRPERSD